MPPQVDC